MELRTLTQITDCEKTAHLRANIQPVREEYSFVADSLPFEKLLGPGFERLCYVLLISRGYSPLYFGNTGQKQWGIDLLVEENGDRVVYQCKNAEVFSTSDMIATLKKFESEWLQQKNLPRPKKFVLCMSRDLQDVNDIQKWEEYRKDFSEKHQIEVGTSWNRRCLNETLKKHPDIVAEIFSDGIASFFCGTANWAYDQFHPLAEGATHPSLKRYLSSKTDGRLYLDPKLVDEFTEKLERNGRVLIRGLPGAGKTFFSLAVSEKLTRYRVYYLSLREDISNDALVKGIKDRLSRRTIFLLDDCQGKFVQLDQLMVRVDRLLQGRTDLARFIFLARRTPTPEGMPRGDEITDFEEDLKQADAVLELAPDRRTFRQIIEKSKPELLGLEDERLAGLCEFAGHDLFLLDQLLETLDNLAKLDDLNLDSLFQKTIARYFGKGAVVLPGFMHLAALSQFDLAPRVDKFPHNLTTEDKGATTDLIANAGQPPRYFFLHSSAAELIFRAICKNNGITDHAVEAAVHLTKYFSDQGTDNRTLADDLSKVVRNRLKLADENQDARAKNAFLCEDAIYELVERNFSILPLNLLAICCLILKNMRSGSLDRYEKLIQSKVEDGTALLSAATKPFWESSLFLRLTKQDSPYMLELLRRQFTAESGLRSLAQKMELQNFLMLLSILNEPEKHAWHDWLNDITDNEFEAMISQTIESGRSIGTLNFALRELKESDDALLRQLEGKIGASRFLRLIAANGSVFELFKVVENSTLEFATELIGTLDEERIEQLIAQTIESGRSIGTLNFALRELKESDDALLRQLEGKIGASRFLRLIAANGSVFELFRVIQYSTLGFAKELIGALDEERIEQLIAQTIESGRSIGALHYTIRYLQEADGTLLEHLEKKIGVDRWWRLVCSFGSINILSDLLRAFDKPFQQNFIQAAKTLPAGEWEKLLRQNGFYELCRLVKNFPRFFSARFPPDFLKPTLAALLQSSNWEARNLGWLNLSNAPTSVGKDFLLELLNEQLRGTKPGTLNFLTFSEAAHGVSLLWRLLPAKQNDLADALMRFTQAGKPVYSDPAYMCSVRLLFLVFATPQARRVDARFLLSLGNCADVAKLCGGATTLDLFLYLWNLYALWFEWRDPQEDSFAKFLNADIAAALIASLSGRMQASKDKQETSNLIALIGLMCFFGISSERSPALKGFLSKLDPLDELVFQVNHKKPFIPSVFFLLGVEWLFQDEQGVPPQVWREQDPKADKYFEKTEALKSIRSIVTRRSKSS
jgi:uncharacterized protein YoaH (UPF0181 family)